MMNVALSIQLDTDLDRIQEYEKFSKTIKNIDKNIEKICFIIGLQYFIGNMPIHKYRRQDIVK
jgi:hypothetical protein